VSEDLLATLRSGPLYRFADWPNPEVPNWRAGVYAVWEESTFLYVGMAGRALATGAHLLPEPTSSTRNRGLKDRLNTHASGRRSGDQFCVYICDRMVLRDLTEAQLGEVTAGRLTLDGLVRACIRERLTYRFVVTETSQEAHDLERAIRAGGLDETKPMLNPLLTGGLDDAST
jgi:hypothetical protein